MTRGKRIYARIRWTELVDGKKVKREKFAAVRTRSDGREKIKQMLRELEDSGPESFDADRMTFADLAAIYKSERLIPAEYSGEQKIAGLRSLPSAKTQLKRLVEGFGPRRIRSITWDDIADYQRRRSRQTTRLGKPPVIATINRELERLRAVFNYAIRCGWLLRNPFAAGQPLIHKADEGLRERIPTLDEQAAILAQCVGRRAHLRPILILLRDTGVRPGEAFRLTVADIDLTPPHPTLTITQMNSKTGKQRLVGLTEELTRELTALIRRNSLLPADRLFGLNGVRRSYDSACAAAGVEGVTLYAWRHLNATDMVRAGVPDAIAMKSLGHTEYRTFKRYVTVDREVAGQAADALTAYRKQKTS